MTPKASRTRSNAATKAWATRRKPHYRARHSEVASKRALSVWCKENRWKVVFFEGPTGAPRTGIADAIMVRIKPRTHDVIEIRLVQLKSGVSGLSGREITRLKDATRKVSVDWVFAAYDGDLLRLVPDVRAGGGPQVAPR